MEDVHDTEVGSGSREAGSRRRRFVRPAVDIFSSAEESVLLADVPGVQKTDLSVTVEGDELVIDAGVAGRAERESRLPWGYYRRFRLSPEIDRESIRAELNDGVLRITLGKLEPDGERKVVDVD